MIHLVYVSTATKYMSDDELDGLLKQSRSRNKRQEVTGMLLYAKGGFIQVLEGNQSDVEEIYNSITNDSRNYGCITILKEDIDKRDFPDWTMGFRRITQGQQDDISGFTNFMNDLQSKKPANSSVALDLLYQFRENS